MNFDTLTSFIAPIGTIFIGVLLKITNEEKAKPYKKFWIWLILMGIFLLAFKIYDYSK